MSLGHMVFGQKKWNKNWVQAVERVKYFNQGILNEKYHCTVDLLFDWIGISCLTTGNFCFYLQNRLIQTRQTGGLWYSDTSPPLVFLGLMQVYID
jgi:hypothetical protein